jgi:tRNA C32,U32 (ribose-2'-O)-methylase TrmJ
MKTLKLVLAMISLFLLFFAGCITFVSIGQTAPGNPDVPALNLVIAAVLSAYEILVRAVPSVRDYSILSFAIKLLKKLSDSLNRIKKPPE